MTDNIFIPEILEKENCRIVINKDFLELTRITEVEGAEFSASETRYHNLIENVRIEDFDFLWLNSWLLEEVEQRGDYEVVINRKHNEIVLGKVKERTTYEFEGEAKKTVTWEHKYLPFYPYLSTQDLLDQFNDFWELEPYVMSARAVPTGDYEIAGQVLEDRLDLGLGYENLCNRLHTFESGYGWYLQNSINDTVQIYITPKKNNYIVLDYNIGGSKSGEYFINIEYRLSSGQKIDRVMNQISYKSVSLDDGFTRITSILKRDGSSSPVHLYPTDAIPEGTTLEVRYISLLKGSESKPFIKNSRPDSKMALPQLAQLGAITSTEMYGNHLVAQHENGTAIIKNAVINENAPLSSLHWGIQAYKDADGNKRLFVSTADGTYPVGWSNLKYDAEEGGNVVFYDVARNSTSNNIAGLITDDMKVYIGEGYSNITDGGYYAPYHSCVFDQATSTYNFTRVEAGTLFSFSGSSLLAGDVIQISFTIESSREVNRVRVGNTFLWNNELVSEEFNPITKQYKGVMRGVQGAHFAEFHTDISFGVGEKISFKNFQITKTSTPKPFTAGIVPRGTLKTACDENKSIITKGNKKNTMNSTVFYVYDNKRYEGINNSAYDFSETINSKVFTGAYESNSYKTILRVNADSSFNGFFRVGALAGNWNCEYVSQILIYNNPNLTQAQMEGELAKDIYLPTYHHQPNSVINAYSIQGMSDMFLYSPALTDAEINEELEKNIELKEIGDITIGLETIKGALVYDGDVVEEDIEKDINPKPYHWQDNSVINKYKVKGMQGIHLYKPSLSEIEILDECSRELEIINRGENGELFPNNLGEIIEI